MDTLDLLIILAALAAAVGGFRLGFLTRAGSWIGLGLGLFVAGEVLPGLVRTAALSSETSRLFLTVGTLMAGAVLGQILGLVVGARLHDLLPVGPAREVDRGVGAVAGVAGVIAVLWLLLPTLASVAGWPSQAASGSTIARWVAAHLPPPPNTFTSLRRLVGQDDFPQVFSDLGSGGNAGPVPAASGLPSSVVATVSASAVKIQGEACDRIQSGSGFVAAPGIVATNAHVVAGEPSGRTEAITFEGRALSATVVAFDPNRDIALLAVPGLTAAPLPLATGSAGQVGAVFGHPGGQATLAVQPARIASEIRAEGGNIYGTGTTRRDVFVLAARLQQGDSGGALVTSGGAVVGVAFAISENNANQAYALSSSEVRAVLAEPHASRVSTGSCLDG